MAETNPKQKVVVYICAVCGKWRSTPNDVGYTQVKRWYNPERYEDGEEMPDEKQSQDPDDWYWATEEYTNSCQLPCDDWFEVYGHEEDYVIVDVDGTIQKHQKIEDTNEDSDEEGDILETDTESYREYNTLLIK